MIFLVVALVWALGIGASALVLHGLAQTIGPPPLDDRAPLVFMTLILWPLLIVMASVWLVVESLRPRSDVTERR